MKKNNLKLIFRALLLSLLVISCDNLERFPTNQIETGQAFKTVKDAASWSNGMYAKLRGNIYGKFMFTTDVQADELNASMTYGNRNGFPHRWTGFLADDYTIRDVWAGYYNAIANINLAIEGFQGIVPANSTEAADMVRYDAEAHLARALYYHKLVVRFAKMYNPATANTDLGVPLVLKYDVNEFPSRSTVKQVYDQILDDITVAKTGLSSVTGSQGAIRFTEDVALALEARVRFYMQDWTGAKSIADQLTASSKYPLITTQAGLTAMWHNDASQEVIMTLSVSPPNENANTNSIYLGFQAGTGYYQPDFIPSQWVVDMYTNNDFRKNVFFEQKTVDQNGTQTPNVWLVNKYPGNPALFTGASTNYQHAPIIFRIAEMYLISAESALHIPGGDALTPLNAIRVARNLPTVSLTGSALNDAVKEERTKELAFEGFRLDDLRRWNEGFTRHDPQNSVLINTGSDFDTKTVAAGADKFTWGIPSRDITVNKNLAGEQNPGW